MTEISRNSGREGGCERERIYGSKFPIPPPQDRDSLCQGRGRRKEKGNKGTKRKLNPSPLAPTSPGAFPQQFEKRVFFISFLKPGEL